MLLTLIHPILVHDRRRSVDALAVDRVKFEEGVVLLAAVEVAVGALECDKHHIAYRRKDGE
jgi:hypothetical protein